MLIAATPRQRPPLVRPDKLTHCFSPPTRGRAGPGRRVARADGRADQPEARDARHALHPQLAAHGVESYARAHGSRSTHRSLACAGATASSRGMTSAALSRYDGVDSPLASDGVWELLSSQTVVDIVENVKSLDPNEICDQIIDQSSYMWKVEEGGYRDDITVVLNLFPWQTAEMLVTSVAPSAPSPSVSRLSLIHISRCRRIERCRSRWSPYH